MLFYWCFVETFFCPNRFLLIFLAFLVSSKGCTVQDQVAGKAKQHDTPQQQGQSSEPLSERSVLHETPEEAQPIEEELAKRFMEVLNSLQKNQLSFFISSSMYQDPQQIRDLLKIMWNKNYDRLHFLFRVEYLDANSSRVGSIVSEKGQDWGYLSLSSDLASLVYGSFAGHLPSNLLAFFRPVFEAVAQLRGTKLTRNPPKPCVIPFQGCLKEEDSKGISSRINSNKFM